MISGNTWKEWRREEKETGKEHRLLLWATGTQSHWGPSRRLWSTRQSGSTKDLEAGVLTLSLVECCSQGEILLLPMGNILNITLAIHSNLIPLTSPALFAPGTGWTKGIGGPCFWVIFPSLRPGHSLLLSPSATSVASLDPTEESPNTFTNLTLTTCSSFLLPLHSINPLFPTSYQGSSVFTSTVSHPFLCIPSPSSCTALCPGNLLRSCPPNSSDLLNPAPEKIQFWAPKV